MLSKSDKNWLTLNFVASDDLKALEDRIDKKLDEKLTEKLRFVPTKNLFLEQMAKLMGEVKTMRESQELHAGTHTEINDEIDKLKKVVTPNN